MKSSPFLVLLFSLVTASDICSANGIPVVRIICEEEDIGTKIYINEEYTGDCPIDVPVSPGIIKVRAHKIVDTEYEQIFETEVPLYRGGKRVEIMLSKPRLTADAQHARQLKAQQQAEQAAQADLYAAQTGDIKAMKAVAQRYAQGKGLPQDAGQARIWRQKAEIAIAEAQFTTMLRSARTGDISAMQAVAQCYEAGHGVSRDTSEASRWNQKAATAKQEIRNQEIAKKEREVEAYKRAEAERISEEKRKALDEFTFFKNVKANNKTKGMAEHFSSTTFLPLAIVSDITSLPARSSELRKIKNRYAALPSKWAKPDSMLAKVYRRQKASNL